VDADSQQHIAEKLLQIDTVRGVIVGAVCRADVFRCIGVVCIVVYSSVMGKSAVLAPPLLLRCVHSDPSLVEWCSRGMPAISHLPCSALLRLEQGGGEVRCWRIGVGLTWCMTSVVCCVSRTGHTLREIVPGVACWRQHWKVHQLTLHSEWWICSRGRLLWCVRACDLKLLCGPAR